MPRPRSKRWLMPLDESRLPPGWTIKTKTIKGRVWFVAVNDGIKLKAVTGDSDGSSDMNAHCTGTSKRNNERNVWLHKRSHL